MLITFEGIDGSGKSTQAKLLAEHFKRQGIETVFVREPGGTELSERVRTILLNEQHAFPLSATAELLLFAASRAQLIREVVAPALQRGAVVICDRFTDSTIAYQGFGRELPISAIENVNRLASENIEPDLTFLIDVPLELAMRRRKGMGDDRMESESRTFFGHVMRGYMYLAEQHRDRIHVIDGTQGIEGIHDAILRLVTYEAGRELRNARHIEDEASGGVFALESEGELMMS